MKLSPARGERRILCGRDGRCINTCVKRVEHRVPGHIQQALKVMVWPESVMKQFYAHDFLALHKLFVKPSMLEVFGRS